MEYGYHQSTKDRLWVLNKFEEIVGPSLLEIGEEDEWREYWKKVKAEPWSKDKPLANWIDLDDGRDRDKWGKKWSNRYRVGLKYANEWQKAQAHEYAKHMNEVMMEFIQASRPLSMNKRQVAQILEKTTKYPYGIIGTYWTDAWPAEPSSKDLDHKRPYPRKKSVSTRETAWFIGCGDWFLTNARWETKLRRHGNPYPSGFYGYGDIHLYFGLEKLLAPPLKTKKRKSTPSRRGRGYRKPKRQPVSDGKSAFQSRLNPNLLVYDSRNPTLNWKDFPFSVVWKEASK